MSGSPASLSRPTRTALKASVIAEWRTSASSNRMLSTYEISDDLNQRQVQVVERRYGGRLRAPAAATRIQRAFQRYRMMQQWRRLVVPLQPCDTSITHIRYIESVARWRASSANGVSHPRRICDAPRYANASESSLQQQHWARRAYIFSTSTFSDTTDSQSNGNSIPTRYHPSVSLSVQLRATRSKKCHSPPSLARLEPEPNEHRPYMELMSLHLYIAGLWPIHLRCRRAVFGYLRCCSPSSARSRHTNSLPRIDTHAMHSTPLSSDIARQQAISEQQRRRQYRIAVNFFNKKAARGIQFLLKWGFVEENAHAVAKLLIGRRGFSKQVIGEYLGHLRDPFRSSVLGSLPTGIYERIRSRPGSDHVAQLVKVDRIIVGKDKSIKAFSRHRFVADVRESIAECAEMDAIRIRSELVKHTAGGLSRSESQRDSGVPDYEGASLGNDVGNGSGLSKVVRNAHVERSCKLLV